MSFNDVDDDDPRGLFWAPGIIVLASGANSFPSSTSCAVKPAAHVQTYCDACIDYWTLGDQNFVLAEGEGVFKLADPPMDSVRYMDG